MSIKEYWKEKKFLHVLFQSCNKYILVLVLLLVLLKKDFLLNHRDKFMKIHAVSTRTVVEPVL